MSVAACHRQWEAVICWERGKGWHSGEANKRDEERRHWERQETKGGEGLRKMSQSEGGEQKWEAAVLSEWERPKGEREGHCYVTWEK